MLPRLYQTCGSDPAKAPRFSGEDDDDGPSTSAGRRDRSTVESRMTTPYAGDGFAIVRCLVFGEVRDDAATVLAVAHILVQKIPQKKLSFRPKI
jgi:hypothetical protein